MTSIKICGLMELEHALIAADSGVEFIGLVFAASKRRVGSTRALEIASAVHAAGLGTEVVGVFVNEKVDIVNQISEQCCLDRVQLSGDESWDYCQQIIKPVIKAIHVLNSEVTGEIAEQLHHRIAAGYSQLHGKDIIFLLDSKFENQYGGTGKTFNWQPAKAIASDFPVIIAGGLTPENVSDVISEVNPCGVDVSSGVEKNNRKDSDRITSFVRAVREAERILANRK